MAENASKGAGDKADAAKEKEDARRKAQEEADAEPTYSTEELIDSARSRLGVSPHAVAGALHKGTKAHFTIDEAKQRLDEFLSSETDHAYEEAV